MYSLLLMTAMVGSPDAAAFGWRSNGGCGGCHGGVAVGCSGYSSCHGGGYSGCGGFSCSGYSCNGSSSCKGCNGGGFLGLGDRWHSRRASCNGCSGNSCHGSSCYGSSCHGGGHSAGWGSCYGSGAGAGCWGSCYGSGVGSGCWGSSCYGSGMGAGCHGGAACYGASVGSTWINPIPAAPVMTAPAAPVAPAAPTTGGTSSQGPARLTVELPTTAKLFVDGAEVAGTGTTRQFHTPELAAGGSFFYDLRAEVEVNGSVQTEEKRVVVRAGETVTASFAKLAAAAGEAGAVAAK
jgi:uncharacterized protein (TIGR03000 family)